MLTFPLLMFTLLISANSTSSVNFNKNIPFFHDSTLYPKFTVPIVIFILVVSCVDSVVGVTFIICAIDNVSS